MFFDSLVDKGYEILNSLRTIFFLLGPDCKAEVAIIAMIIGGCIKVLNNQLYIFNKNKTLILTHTLPPL